MFDDLVPFGNVANTCLLLDLNQMFYRLLRLQLREQL